MPKTEGLVNVSPPWYASSPDIEPTSMPLYGRDRAEDANTIEITQQLIDLVNESHRTPEGD
jgi:hypothetical protein